MARQRDIIEIEQWKEVPGLPGYKVSSLGRVIGVRGHLLKQFLSNTGYPTVPVTENRITRTHLTHRWLAHAFLGPQEPGMHVHHRNNIKTDNRLMNLEYVTVSQNGLAKHGHGTMPVGERNASAVLTADKVRCIRDRYDAGVIPRLLAEDFGISRTQVVNIGKRRQWRHI